MVTALRHLRIKGSQRNPSIQGAASLKGRRIGLLGGSFNPAHEGHLHLSLTALHSFALDEIWWLVTPQNPLKDEAMTSPLDYRLAVARQHARHPAILVSAVERDFGTTRTAETLMCLKNAAPGARFIWLGGADTMAEMDSWWNWRQLPYLMPIAIFDRPGYSVRALTSRFAREFGWARVGESDAKELLEARIPAWTFVFCRRHPGSATAIRKAQE